MNLACLRNSNILYINCKYLIEYSHNWLYSIKLIKGIISISLFFSWLLPLSAQQMTISGFVTDNSTGETLIGANVYDSATYRGTTTNNRGFFSITLKKGVKTIQISYVGYELKSYKLNLVKDTAIKFRLDAGIKLEEVQIRSIKTESDFLKGRLSLPMIKMQELPSLGGETDLIKALTTLPGITPTNEGSSAMVVRGGGSDQNLFILDGIQVYNTGHLFNFISVFNPEAIKRVDFYKGTFPSKYGGRLSSVTDITFKDGNSNKFKGSFDIGLIDSKLTLEGPINEKTTFLMAGRITYLDVFTPFRRASIKNKKKFNTSREPINDEMVLYTFADLNFKVNHKFDNKNSISFNLYSGVDYYRIFNNYELQSEKNKYTLLNNVVSVKTTHVISPRLFAFTMIGFTSNSGNSKLENTQYHKNSIYDPITKQRVQSIVFEREDKSGQKSFVRDISSAIDFSYFSSNSNTLNFGISGIKHFYQPGIYTTEVTDTIDNKIPLLSSFRNKEYSTLDGSLYIEDEINYQDRIHITGGVRANLFKSYDKTFKSFEPRL
ncbi:MAG: TonB-dependent receptor, partial [Trichloromonas sp.]|nr:TonB-dependent receptor [Trichloromonas sp.]